MKSIIQQDWDTCFLCGRVGEQVHHIFGGKPNRKYSDDDGLTVRLCAACHREVHEGKNTKKLMKALHELGQTVYEETHTREDFMDRYGRNYL